MVWEKQGIEILHQEGQSRKKVSILGSVGSVGTVVPEIREYCKGRQNLKSLN